MAFISVTLIGNLTREPELRVTPKGTAIVQFGIAANKKWKDDNGQPKEKACFLDVEAWGKTAENLAKYFHKGNPIFLMGSLELDTWEDKTTQAKRSKHKLVAERFEFIGGREQPAESPSAGAPDPRPRPYGDGQQENPTYGKSAPRQAGLPGVSQPPLDEDVPF